MPCFRDSASAVNLIWLDAVDSTNDWADRLIAAALEADETSLPDTVLVATTQSGGRGRGANRWVSPPGGLYATWFAWIPVETLQVLPLAVAVACAEAVEALLSGVSVGLKWPNDLVVGGRKLGGILAQARGAGDAVWVRVGFGINVAVTPVLASGDPVRPVSLAELGWKGDVEQAARALVNAFVRHVRPALTDPERTRERWQARLVHRPGERMRVRLETAVVDCRFVGLTPEGHLEVEVDGRLERIVAGELVPRSEDDGGDHAPDA
ncbi:MAG TPA: biotin--[acetyl-CoA-carboxylase] ligase [Thermoanaerobaculaceae bacterium]|nr:biotin--[acetyl-CoA-carboxylase] ligase [Thermoanaerobaculaceae bacterium]